jgi:hypothetical protein
MLTYPRLENQGKIFEHDIICSPEEVDGIGIPVCSASCDDEESTQNLELGSKITGTNLILGSPALQAMDSSCSSKYHKSGNEITKHSRDPEENMPLSLNSPQVESEVLEEDNIDRWFEEPIDPFEVEKRAVVETLASEPELAAFAIPLFESQWKLGSFALSPGTVSCVTEDTPTQTYTPSSSQDSSGKRKAQALWTGSSQSNKVTGQEDEEEEEEDEEPQQKRLKGSKEPEGEPLKLKFGCPFHKRHPTIYCLSKDPNMGTKEQKKWSICAGQGFLHLRHLM